MADVDRGQLEFSADSQDEAENFNNLFIGLVRSVQEIAVVTHTVL